MYRTISGIVLGGLAVALVWDARLLVVEVARVDVTTRMVTDAGVPESGFASLLLAVEAASNRYNPDSIVHDREHVGAILRCDRGYFYTHGVGEPGQSPVTFSIAVPKRCDLTSLWHTHGGPFADREYFSPSDTRSADRLGKPMFMTNHKGLLYVYRPGAPKASRLPRLQSVARVPIGSAPGEIVTDGAGNRVRIATRATQPGLAADDPTQ